MNYRTLIFLLLICILIGNVSSCGKANGSALENVDCGYRWIAGHDCIVCEHGGVSCKWN